MKDFIHIVCLNCLISQNEVHKMVRGRENKLLRLNVKCISLTRKLIYKTHTHTDREHRATKI